MKSFNSPLLPFAACVLALMVTGCTADEEPSLSGPGSYDEASCTVCVAGVKSCHGAWASTCSEDGKAASPLMCGGSQVCKSGDCKSSTCPSAGFKGCADETTLSACSNGALTEAPCDANEVCAGGACVSAICEEGATSCGHFSLATCSGGSWEVVECAAGETCSETTGVAACGSQKCSPGERTCADKDGDGYLETIQVCNALGTGGDPALTVNCGATQAACFETDLGAFCQCAAPKRTSVEPEEQGGGEESGAEEDLIGEIDIQIGGEDFVQVGGDIPPSEKPDLASAYKNGEEISFDSYASVNFQENPETPGIGTLQLIMAAGQKTLELQIGGVSPDWSGSINADALGEVAGLMGYNDGTASQEEVQGFKWGAGGDYGGNYDFTIDTNEYPDGRITGSFLGLLNIFPGQVGQEQIEFEDGAFDLGW